MSLPEADGTSAGAPLAGTPLPAWDVAVREIRPEADGVVSVLLEDPDGGELPAWAPGAHLDVRLGDGLERQYSLCGDPGDRRAYRVAVLHEPDGRGGSRHIHATLRVGDRLAIRGPRNHFALDPAPAYRFIAGGIGITPILPMLARAEASGADWRLLYGGRSRETMAFLPVIERHADRVRVRPEDVHGLLDLEAELADLPPGTLVYCCGPTPLLGAVEQHCSALPEGTLRVERFAPAEPVAPQVGDGSIEVVCARSGVTVEVGPDETILDALRDAGVDVDSSCEEGTCGTCEVRVLEGRPDHRDYVLSDADRREGQLMLVCCSRAEGDRLVLDL